MINKEIEDINKLKDMLEIASKNSEATLKLDSKACELLLQYIDQLEKENLSLEIQRRISLLDLQKGSSTTILKNILNMLGGSKW